MLVKNAENLLDAIAKMLSAAEATSVKVSVTPSRFRSRNVLITIHYPIKHNVKHSCCQGYEKPPEDAGDDNEAVVLATRWKRKMAALRWRESNSAETDELGLRRVSQISPGPKLEQYISSQ